MEPQKEWLETVLPTLPTTETNNNVSREKDDDSKKVTCQLNEMLILNFVSCGQNVF